MACAGNLDGARVRMDKINITIRSLTGRNWEVGIAPGATVEHLKQEIQVATGIPPDQNRLIFAGVQLEDHLTLEHCGIAEGSIVHLVLRVRAGPASGSILLRHGLSIVPCPAYLLAIQCDGHGSCKYSRGMRLPSEDIVKYTEAAWDPDTPVVFEFDYDRLNAPNEVCVGPYCGTYISSHPSMLTITNMTSGAIEYCEGCTYVSEEQQKAYPCGRPRPDGVPRMPIIRREYMPVGGFQPETPYRIDFRMQNDGRGIALDVTTGPKRLPLAGALRGMPAHWVCTTCHVPNDRTVAHCKMCMIPKTSASDVLGMLLECGPRIAEMGEAEMREMLGAMVNVSKR